MLCWCLSGGLQAGIRKSNLKVLYVGGSPDVDYVGNRPDSAVLAQSSAKRMASFDKMLKRYFRQVTVIRAQAYRPELSDNYDVTVMDGRPAPILPGIMERDSSGRLTRYEKTGYRYWKVTCPYLPAHYPGTGDTFTSVITGSLMQGDSLPMALDRATQFILQGIRATFGYEYDNREGILLEKVLHNLDMPIQMASYELI